ncbi:MAG: hypothetical protein Ta2G_02300 [Termitinemataceae bacterium]|nr:MAG: hypothetical protein Ta2G_02300 [Termitinemataceae bacterium]
MRRIFKTCLFSFLLISIFLGCRTTPPPPPIAGLKQQPLSREDGYEPLTPALLESIERNLKKSGRINDIADIQFYLSSDVTLFTNEFDTKLIIENHDVKKTKENKYRKILFKQATPGQIDLNRGVKTSSDQWKLGISFDNTDNLLWFEGDPSKRYDDFFYLQPLNINYGGTNYSAAINDTNIPHLMIRMNREDKIKIDKQERVAEGKPFP